MRHSPPDVVATALLLISLLLPPVHAAPQGFVGYDLQMGGPVRQSYACVFSGVVTCHGNACAGAHVEATVAGDHDQAFSETVNADDQGHYLVKVTLDGSPEEATLWKLTAKPAVVGAEPAEVEGQLILMDETTLVIDRPIQI